MRLRGIPRYNILLRLAIFLILLLISFHYFRSINIVSADRSDTDNAQYIRKRGILKQGFCLLFNCVDKLDVKPHVKPEIITCSQNGSEYVERDNGTTTRFIHYPLNINMTALIETYKHNPSKVEVPEINAMKIDFITSPHERCTHEHIFLIYAVKSAPGNFQNRKTIRETWGKEDISKKHSILTVFLLGISKNKTIENQVLAEIEQYKDIVKLSYIDSYYNNTRKAMGGLDWVVTYCRTAKFVIFGDDDFYFGTKLVLQYLDSVPLSLMPSFFSGSSGLDVVERGEGGKWSLTMQQYPYYRYPPYLRAGAMIMSLEYAEKLNIASRFTKHIPFDDVFFGLVSCKLGVQPINQTQISIWWKADYNDVKTFKNVIASHHYKDPMEIRKAWKVHLILNP